MPKLLIQPLVENAIKYGMDEQEGQLRVSLRQEGDYLVFEVWDNGKGMPQEKADRLAAGETAEDQERTHIGVSNAIGHLRGGLRCLHLQQRRVGNKSHCQNTQGCACAGIYQIAAGYFYWRKGLSFHERGDKIRKKINYR